MTINLRIVVCAFSVLVASMLGPFSASIADDAVNPHWNKAACQTCHVDAAPTAGNLAFKEPDPGALCAGCHAGRGDAPRCRHNSSLVPGNVTIPESYKGALDDGKIVCTTCHDLSYQCLNPHPGYRGTNPGFVRERESHVRGEACFACHEKAAFEQLNPHAMEAGNPAQPTCTLCHATMPLKDERGWVSVDFHVDGSLNDICFGCHRVEPHPGFSFSGPIGWDHLAVPSSEIRDNMERAEAAQGFKFPMDRNTGEIYCATCHNPHHESLEGYTVAKTQGAEHRLRVADNCQACHDL